MTGLVGESRSMKDLAEIIGKAAPACATVLIQGESGTGKELAARALHAQSGRRTGPFVAFNCAALTETLTEAELFGYERGAFTGAVARKIGRFEAANSGTLFLDEIGELSLLSQAKLLRVLEQSEVDRVGGTAPVRVDVRIIAATNRNLDEAVSRHLFRADLLYRLNVVTIHTPPLRERPEDIPVLARHFLGHFKKDAARPITGISSEAMEALCTYSWPGNVRELRNAIHRAVVLGSRDTIQRADLPRALQTATQTLHDAVREAERQFVRKTFVLAGHDYNRAASMLAVSRKNMRRFLERLDLAYLAKRGSS